MSDSFFPHQVEHPSLSVLPTLPEFFIPRSAPLSQLRGLITAATIHTVVISAKDGLGGMGKTALALALAQDSVVQRSFPDGILWGTLGQDPDPLTILGQWLKQLDPYGLQTPTLTHASEQLRHAVKGKKLLLIVDELWELEDLAPFRVVAGTASRLLVTTRDVNVPQSEGVSLGEMSSNQSLQLFEAHLKQSLEQQTKKDALQFAKSVGYLPLSLTLAAAKVKSGLSWADLNAKLQMLQSPESLEETSRSGLTRPLSNLQSLLNLRHVKELQHQTRQTCLKFCLDQLSPELRLRFAILSLFPRNVEITPKMARRVWHLSISETRQRLQQLKQQGFLSYGQENLEQGQVYHLNSVMRDLGQWILSLPTTGEFQGLGLSWPEAHQQFLERYGSQLEQGQWHTIPDDGYIHTHFLWHLEQAQRVPQIHQLLQTFNEEGRNAWYEVCKRLGLASEFRVDLARAWQLAQDLYSDSPDTSIGLQVRYALMSSFLRELEGPKPVEKKSQGFAQDEAWRRNPENKSDRLQEDWAFTHVLLQAARYLPDLATKIIKSTYYPSTLDEALKETTIVELLKTVHLDSPDRVLELTTHLLPSPTAIAALSKLLPDYPILCLPLLNLVENASQAQSIAEGMIALVNQPNHKLHPELFNALPKLEHPLDQITLLDRFKHRLPAILQPKVKAFRRKSLAHLYMTVEGMGVIPLEDIDVLQGMNRATADFLDQYQYQGKALALCFETYPSPLLDSAYEQAMTCRAEAKRSKFLAFLIPKLSEKHRRSIWMIRDQFVDPECKARVLRAFLPYRTDALAPLLDLLKLFENQTKLDFLMESLPAPAAIVKEIYKTLRAVNLPSDRWPYTVKLLPHVHRNLEAGFLEVLEEMPYEKSGMLALLQALKPQQKQIQAGIIDQIAEIPPAFERATALRDITPFLTEEMMAPALKVAQQIQFPYAKVIALQNFIPTFPELGQEAIAALRNCHQESPDDIYEALIPKLPEAEKREAIALMNAIADESSQLTRLLRVLPYQPELAPQVKRLARNQNLELAEVLNELHALCTRELAEYSTQPPQTLDLIQATFPLVDELFQPGVQIPSSHEFSPLLERYFAHPETEQVPTQTQLAMLLDFFYLIGPEPQRAPVLARLISRVTEKHPLLPEEWMAWLERIARFRPHEFHWLLSSLLNSLMGFSTPAGLNQILQSIRSVRAQWTTD